MMTGVQVLRCSVYAYLSCTASCLPLTISEATSPPLFPPAHHRSLYPQPPHPPTLQLADFGLTKLLLEHDVVNLFGAGTATHLAPELLRAGTKISTAADVYAFGVIMWECYVAKRAFAGESLGGSGG